MSTDLLIPDMFVPADEWTAREKERLAKKLEEVRAEKRREPKPAVATKHVNPVGARDPFDILEEALNSDEGRRMIKAALKELGDQLDKGYGMISMRLAIEVARHKAAGGAGMPGAFRLDNRIAPALTRMILRVKPELRGKIEVRRMTAYGESAEVAAAYGNPALPMPLDQRLGWLDYEHPLRPLAKDDRRRRSAEGWL